MLAKIVNDNAALQGYRGVLRFFASKLAPTVNEVFFKLADQSGRFLAVLFYEGPAEKMQKYRLTKCVLSCIQSVIAVTPPQSFRCQAATHTATTNKKEDCSER